MASLTDLPVEALVIIFNFFQPRREPYEIHMHKPSLNTRDLSIRRELQKQDNHLMNLCSTRLVAQPIAYQSISKYNYINWGLSLSAFLHRFGSLTKTLSERPDLAANVKFLDIHMLDRFEDDKRMPRNATDEQKLAVSRLSSRVGLEINITEDWHDWDIAEAYFQILMVLLPNLSHTNICLPGSWKLESLSTWAARPGSGVGLARPFLANVRHMELDHMVADLNSRYERSDYETLNDDEIEHISSSVERLFVDAAPNLELLCCSAGGLDSLPRLQKLDTLQIMMKSSWDGMLPKVMKGFPSLRRLSYKSTTDYCPSPKQSEQTPQSPSPANVSEISITAASDAGTEISQTCTSDLSSDEALASERGQEEDGFEIHQCLLNLGQPRADIVSESQAAFAPIVTATQPAACGCACLSVLYLLLEHLRVEDQLTAPNDFALLRSTIESASEVLTCQKCPLRYFSIVQNAALLGVLCLCVAESYHRIVRSIDEEEKRASEAGEKKQLGIHNGADQANQPSVATASPLFQVEVSPSQWGSMMRNLVKAEVFGIEGQRDKCLQGFISRLEQRQRRWHQTPPAPDCPPSYRSLCGSSDREPTCLKLIDNSKRLIGLLEV
ncbi:hypothetical protein CGCA056_v008883 [Colletotrichum aenigma]|uniref:uncharacterized protein n=1 Tax=Colletotrichum aenigma TaxID=1215731 RepID=UPI0018726156|nr:uncharacterized protein CGCA056_v008883 [Colletotrichum aenigma]KAF5520937.1 hypothetical protein CGCA056_v008883 [Colletotrichum aenigma]